MTLTIGLVGAGQRAGRIHAPTLAHCPQVRFAGIWARSPRAARTLAEQHDVAVYDRFEDLLDNCEAVAFAVPPPVQAELGVVAARRGRALLLERPMAGDIAGAEELAETVEARKVVSQLGLSWRYDADVRRFIEDARRIKPDGGVGRLISGTHLPGRPVPTWRAERGVLRDEGADLVDLLEAVLGPIVGVRAHGSPTGWIGLLLDHQVGRFSEASMSATSAPDFFRADVEIFGGGGTAFMDCTKAPGPDAYDSMYREFAAAVRQGIPPPLDARHGLHLQRVIEAAETDTLLGT